MENFVSEQENLEQLTLSTAILLHPLSVSDCILIIMAFTEIFLVFERQKTIRTVLSRKQLTLAGLFFKNPGRHSTFRI